MTPELQKQLEAKYPVSFSRKTTCIEQRGIECDDGWYDVLDRMFSKIEPLISNLNQRDLHDRFDIAQIKEKFGRLTIYLRSDVPGVEDAVKEAYEEASSICESCGGKGSIRPGGWLRTACERCLARDKIKSILRTIDVEEDIKEGKPFEWSKKTRKMLMMSDKWYDDAVNDLLRVFEGKTIKDPTKTIKITGDDNE